MERICLSPCAATQSQGAGASLTSPVRERQNRGPGQAGGRPPDGAPTVSPLERAMRTLQNIFPRPGATTAETPTALTGSLLALAMGLLQRAMAKALTGGHLSLASRGLLERLLASSR